MIVKKIWKGRPIYTSLIGNLNKSKRKFQNLNFSSLQKRLRWPSNSTTEAMLPSNGQNYFLRKFVIEVWPILHLKVCFFQKVRLVFKISKYRKKNPKNYLELEIFVFEIWRSKKPNSTFWKKPPLIWPS